MADKSVYNLTDLSGIKDYLCKWDLDIGKFKGHEIKTGIHLFHHRFQTGALVLKNTREVDSSLTSLLAPLSNNEYSFYLEDKITIGERFFTNVGLRLNYFSAANISNFRLEPRLIINYKINVNNSLKSSYTRMTQPMHLISTHFF